MSSVLEAVMEFKKQRDAQANADINAIPAAINSYQQGQQLALQRQLAQLTNIKTQYDIQDLIEKQRARQATTGLLDKFMGGGQTGDIGFTGASIDPSTGDVKYTLGETPQAKDRREVAQAETKSNLEVQTAIKKDALTRLSKLDELIPLMDQYDQQLESIPVGTGVKGKLDGVGKVVKGKTGADPFVAANLKQIDATRALAARAFGDVGNLSQPEQENAKGFFSQVTDSADTRALNALGGLSLLRKKVIQTGEKAGLSNDPKFVDRLAQIDKRIEIKRAQALELGVDETRLNKFMGESSGLSDESQKTNSFSSVAEAEKANLPKGTIIYIAGKKARVD